MRLHYRGRHGSAAIQFAIVGPVAFMIVFGILVGGLGIFRYNQVSALARQASRWASVHGTQYAKDTGNSAATATDVYNQVIAANAAGLDLTKLAYSVTWNTSNSPSYAATVNGVSQAVANTVTVVVNYNWIPEAYFGGVTLTSTSVTVMSY